MVALSLTVLALAACGASSEPAEETAVATEPAAPVSAGSSSATADATEPEGDIAAKFTLPDATGDPVSLASFAGDKNVVLVFYRGFW